MKKPDIDEISNERANQYRDELRGLEVGHLQDELARIAFKDGYDFALEDFSVPDMIDALIKQRDWLQRLWNCSAKERSKMIDEDMEHVFRRTSKSLSKAGITINETGDE